jgi:hypothetical protein
MAQAAETARAAAAMTKTAEQNAELRDMLGALSKQLSGFANQQRASDNKLEALQKVLGNGGGGGGGSGGGVGGGGKVDKSEVKCYECGQKGHISRDCPSK